MTVETEPAAGFSGPLFKKLTKTDVGEGRAKISGPTLLEDIRDFFPRPTAARDRRSIFVTLVDETASGLEILRSRAPALVQLQGEAPETILSDIGTLRSRCRTGDILLLEPSLSEADHYRVSRVASDAARYDAVNASTDGRRAGLLRGGVLPCDRISGRLRPRSDQGELIRSEFTVSGSASALTVTFESGDGAGRNPGYRRGLTLVLTRLAAMGATLTEMRIVSERLQKSGARGGFEPTGFDIPLRLSGVSDFGKLAAALGTAGALVENQPGSKGSATRRMALDLQLENRGVPLQVIAETLAGCRLPSLNDTVAGDDVPLKLEVDLGLLDQAWAVWIDALSAASRPLSASRFWLDAEAVAWAMRPSRKRTGATDVHLGVRASGAPWTVELDAPRLAADANGLSTVARNLEGRRLLLRQGWLRVSAEAGSDIREPLFSHLTQLQPVRVAGESTPTPRDWFVVCDLDAPAEEIVARTADFVLRCADARSLHQRGVDVETKVSPPLYAGPEAGGWIMRRAREAQPETAVLRIQGEVWIALAARLEEAGLALTKIRHQAGYEVDGVIDTPAGPVLLEIKTGASAADVYEGVGQLMLYAEMLELRQHRKVLLLAFEPAPALIEATRVLNIEVHGYGRSDGVEKPTIDFSEAFLMACGVSAGSEP